MTCEVFWVMPRGGKRSFGMTCEAFAVMPEEEKQGIGMTLGKKATNTREVI